MKGDTIAALATPWGEGGVAILKISGPEAIDIVSKIFKGKKKNLKTMKTYQMAYGFIVDPLTGDEIDEVIVSLMKAPYSYTREDVVEISCHGGTLVARRILEILLAAGARLAEPGEFTRRAFLNGRIDLTQAEAVLELVRARSSQALKIATRKLKGEFGKKIGSFREKLLSLSSWIEASLDFPEEDLPLISEEETKKEINRLILELKKIIESVRAGSLYREGVKIVICGKPNVGKSSLLNALLQEARAIVTSVPGTTRDVIEEVLNVGGIPIRLVDTAGIRQAGDEVEREGVSRTVSQLEEADMVLLVLDSSRLLTEEDFMVMSKLEGRKVVVVYNKKDLPRKIEVEKVREMFPESREVWISALYEDGIEELKEVIIQEVQKGVDLSGEVWMTSLHNIHRLERALECLSDSLNALEQNLTYDIVAVGIQEALRFIGEITGEEYTEDLLETIFSQFCIGK